MRWQDNLRKLASLTEAGMQPANKIMAMIAASVLLAMMLLTVADVFGRYFFNSPIRGTWEIIGLLLVCAGTWGLGYCQLQKAHISIDVLVRRFSQRVKAAIYSLAYLIGLIGFSVICWRVFLLAKRYFFLTRGNATETLHIPYYPFMLIMAIGAGMLALVLLIDLRRSLTEVLRK
jgi:TRAP-type C4-dicarboxylate transport system permease small subunit